MYSRAQNELPLCLQFLKIQVLRIDLLQEFAQLSEMSQAQKTTLSQTKSSPEF